ncbi:MAG: lamin tail domain-containing protein [Fidelibacterota bacterium]
MKQPLSRFLFLSTMISCPISAQLILSEIMFDLEGTDSPNEFVEIFNLSTQDTIDLTGWKISDRSSLDDLVDAGMGTALSPRSYALILEGDYDFLWGLYASVIPDSVLVLKVDDNSIGNQLSTSDSLFLTDGSGNVVDSHGWENISAPGFSLERRRLSEPAIASNWATSVDSLGTPGFINSATPPEIDGAILQRTITHTPQYPGSDETVRVSVTIINAGIQPVEGTVDVRENNEILTTEAFDSLDEQDSVIVEMELPPLSPGIHDLEIAIHVPGDSNPLNDLAHYTITVRFTNRVLTINEFHYAPDPGISEFIEFVNRSPHNLQLDGWTFSDSDTNAVRSFPPQTVASGAYVVMAEDSSLLPFLPLNAVLLLPGNGFPNLNNEGDAIFLEDPSGQVMDSLVYTTGWGGTNGRSVEKLNPELESSGQANWGTSVATAKMTPGARNSIFFESLPSSGSLTLDPNPFSPDGDGHEDELRIAYHIPFDQAYLTILVFDSMGRTVRTLAKNLAVGSEGFITWNGVTDRSRQARIGLYVLKIVAVERKTKQTLEWVKTVVLAHPLR